LGITSLTPGRFFRATVGDRLGLRTWIGLPAAERATVAWTESPLPDEASPAALEAALVAAENPLVDRSLTMGGAFAFPADGSHVTFNDPAIQAGEIPAANGISTAESLARLYAAMQPDRAPLEQHAIVKAAQANDTEAGAVTDMFVRMLGRFAGDMALLFKATGGVYVAGGVAAALGQRLDADIFRHAFEAHPPYPHLLEKIPTSLVTANEMGLLGCAAYAAMLARRKN